MIFSYDDGSAFISHYGTAGMKWGSRKTYVKKGINRVSSYMPLSGTAKNTNTVSKFTSASLNGTKTVKNSGVTSRLISKSFKTSLNTEKANSVKAKLAKPVAYRKEKTVQKKTAVKVNYAASSKKSVNSGLSSNNSSRGGKNYYAVYRRR